MPEMLPSQHVHIERWGLWPQCLTHHLYSQFVFSEQSKEEQCSVNRIIRSVPLPSKETYFATFLKMMPGDVLGPQTVYSLILNIELCSMVCLESSLQSSFERIQNKIQERHQVNLPGKTFCRTHLFQLPTNMILHFQFPDDGGCWFFLHVCVNRYWWIRLKGQRYQHVPALLPLYTKVIPKVLFLD